MSNKSLNGDFLTPLQIKMYDTCIFYNKYIKGNQYNYFNYILFLKEKKPNLNNLNIPNGELFNFMASSVIVHKKCLYRFTIF